MVMKCVTLGVNWKDIVLDSVEAQRTVPVWDMEHRCGRIAAVKIM